MAVLGRASDWLGRAEWLRELWFWGLVLLYLGPVYVGLHPSWVVSVDHAAQLRSLEQTLGLYLEPAVQRLAVATGLEGPLTFVYWASQFFLVWVAVAVLYMVRRPAYRLLRSLILVTWLFALGVFWLWPCAAPDASGSSVHQLAVTPSGAQLYDRFAAMPSLHVACATAVALAVVYGFRSRWRLAALAWPLLVSLAVLGTGNHWLLDAAAGAALAAGCGWLLTRTWWPSWMRSWLVAQ